MRIPLTEVEFSSMSLIDVGRVFWWKNRLFRGIRDDHVEEIEQLFQCGLVKKLVENGLLVRSWISDYEIEGFGLVIEHEVIDVPIYPREWTFSMLKDAALLILDINSISQSFGYQTKDCHGYNVLFKSARPIYVDLGSFKKTETKNNILFSYDEFVRSYYYPLKIWEKGGQHWGIASAMMPGILMSASSYLKFLSPLMRGVSGAFLNKVVFLLHYFWTLPYQDEKRLRRRFSTPVLFILILINKLISSAKIENLKSKIRKISLPREATMWSGYHDEITISESIKSNPRFDLIAEKISLLDIDSVLEFAGNQGGFSVILSELCKIKKVICTDADSYALDKGYLLAKKRNYKIDWVLLNPFRLERSGLELDIEDRLKCDAVIMLAVTHHLILTQGFPLFHILDVASKFTNKFVLIEFMPLGLYNGHSAPAIPSWYSEEWFKSEFEKKFTLIEIVRIEENRTLFIGQTIEGQALN